MATFIELILEKPMKSPMFRYFLWNENHDAAIFGDAMTKEGWAVSWQNITIDEYNEKAVSLFLESFTHRFFEKGCNNPGQVPQEVVERVALAMQKEFPVVRTELDSNGNWSAKPLDIEIFTLAAKRAIAAMQQKGGA